MSNRPRIPKPGFRLARLSGRRPPHKAAPLRSRLPRFVACHHDAEKVFRTLKIMFVGLGSVGLRAAFHLARLGVAELWLVDPKSFKPESLTTHPIAPGAIAKSKVKYAAKRIKAISRRTKVFEFRGSVQDLPLDAFAGLDLVIMATDNLSAEIETGQRCLHFGVPLAHAAVHGETLTTQIRFYANADPNGPCPACGMGELERQQAFREVRFSCEGGNGKHAMMAGLEEPTRSVSSLCSTAADLAMNQVIRHVLGLGRPVGDTLLEHCGYTNEMHTSPLARNAACPCDHTRIEIAASRRELANCTPAGLAKAFGFPSSDKSVTIAAGGFSWLLRGHCCCPNPPEMVRLVASGQKVSGQCLSCRKPIHVMPFHSHRSIPFSTLGKAAARPFREAGAASIEWALLRSTSKSMLIRNSGTSPRAIRT